MGLKPSCRRLVQLSISYRGAKLAHLAYRAPMVPLRRCIRVPIVRHLGSPGGNGVIEGENEVPVAPAPPEELPGSRKFIIDFQPVAVRVSKVHAALIGVFYQTVYSDSVGLQVIVSVFQVLMSADFDGNMGNSHLVPGW